MVAKMFQNLVFKQQSIFQNKWLKFRRFIW